MDKSQAHIEVESPRNSGSGDPVILLLIENSEDRKLFKKYLPDDFTVITGEKMLKADTFDLCIVDGKSSRVHREALESLKEQATPAFLPILLLSQSQEKLQKNTGALEFADDVVYIPTSTELLQSRIQILLRQRRYTLELKKATRKLVNVNQELKEEKEFIDKAIQNMPEIFYVMDEDLNFVKWNNVKGKLGYTDEEVQQMEPLDFLREEDRDLIASKMEEAFETGSAEIEVQMETKGGELIPYFITKKKFSRGDERFLVGSCVNLTKLKQAEYDIEQQRQLLDAIINQTDSIIYVKDEDRRYELVNESYLKLFDMEREDVIGKTDLEIHGGQLDAEVKEADLAVLEKGESLEFEERVPIGDGYKFYHTIKYPLKDVLGFENTMCGISTDITDLKRASNQLRERIKEQQCLYNISSLPEKVSSIEELLERAVTELPGGWQFPEITEAAISFGGKVYKTEGFHKTEWQLSAESNQIEEMPLKIDVVYTDEKERFDEGVFLEEERQLIDSIVETLASQVERLYTQKQLKKSEKRWSDLVKNDPNLIQILEPDGTVQFINEAGAKMLGYETPDEVIGQNYFDIVELEGAEADLAKKRTRKVLEGDEVTSHTYKIRDLNGNICYLESQGVPTTLEDGRTGIQQVAKDVTDREQYEQQLEESLDEKETLLQEIHHRVKNNLAVVSGMMELQSMDTENEEVRAMMVDSQNRIQTMALIHEKLYESGSLSEIEFGTYVKDLLDYVGNVNSMSDDIELDLEYDTFNLNINQAVPCALIVNEIVANAYEHAFVDQDGGTINVLLQQKEDTITITIRDNGRGMSDDFMDRKGYSMGFNIINTLIEQLEAKKNIKSDNGLSFSFWFDKQDIKGASSSLV